MQTGEQALTLHCHGHCGLATQHTSEMTKQPSHWLAASACAAIFATLLSACSDKQVDAPTAAPAPQGTPAKPSGSQPPVPVTTALVQQRSLDILLTATGTATPVAAVEVKPQMSGLITKVHVKEGQTVRAGDLLFTLDTRSDEANVAKIKAQIAKDEALLADAQRQLTRARELLARNFISQGAVDTAQANVESQQANLSSDKASLEAARVPLSYGQVRAPGAGRVGMVPVFPGTAVQANATTLATVTQLDPIDVVFSLPQASLGDLLELAKSGKGRVRVTLPDRPKELQGRLHFVDSVVDAATGTIKAKARLENADQALWPGAFVRVALQTRRLEDALVVPTVAVVQSARGPIVFVAQDNKAAARPVKLVAVQGQDSAVTGLTAGDKVVIEGRQNLRPDTPLVERAASAGKDGAPTAAKPSPASAPEAKPGEKTQP